jgi:hypothetical protein
MDINAGRQIMIPTSEAQPQAQVFIGPGLSLFKRIMTAFGLVVVAGVVVLIAIHEGLPAIGSTIVALLFIGGFIMYLRIIAPIPFTIEVGSVSVVKRSRNGEVIDVPWERLTRIKEEFFPNGKRIGITVYRKPATPEEKTKAWAVYRDDVTDIDALAQSLKSAMPATCQWQSETVHE